MLEDSNFWLVGVVTAGTNLRLSREGDKLDFKFLNRIGATGGLGSVLEGPIPCLAVEKCWRCPAKSQGL